MAQELNASIDLSVTRNIGPFSPDYDSFAVQMLSSDLSANTTFYLDVSLDGTNWDVATQGGTDVSDQLLANATKIMQFNMNAHCYYRIRLDGVTTGNVAYIVRY